jgi:very-short-patch-repair endonuclease
MGVGLAPSSVDRLVRSEIWCRLSRGVYLTAAVEPSWLALVWAGVLIGGDSARVGGRAAAHLWDLTADPPRSIQILIPATGATPRVTGPWYFRRERRGARQPRSYGDPPRTTLEDTVLDLVDDPDADARAVVHWVTTAVQTRRTTPQRLRAAAEARHFLRHRRLLGVLLTDVVAGVRSPLELNYLRCVERAHGLPLGRRQQSQRGTEVDVEYEGYGLLVELDGRLGHKGMGRFKDMRRDNRATTDGLATLRYGWADVYGEPCAVAAEVGQNLRLRGWSGMVTPCPRCRRVA